MKFDLEAKTIYLRLAKEEDAAFICNIRSNEALNTYISKSTADIAQQKKWLSNYKDREKEGLEYYFIICRKEGNLPIGTVRLYDFKTDPKSFCWGSWILNQDKTKFAAVESALLVYEAGFHYLGFEQSHYEVMKGNDKVHSFHLKMGANKLHEDDVNIYYNFSKETHDRNKKHYSRFLR